MKDINLRINEGINKDSKIYEVPVIIAQTSISLCKIDTSFKIGTGFLIKFFKKDKDFFCLMTNEHIITKKLIEQKKSISCYFKFETIVKEIELNTDERYIKEFTDINLDITIIEILPKDNIEYHYFLLPMIDININELINKEITILQYPLGGKLSYSSGKIIEINENEITHRASTNNGSSGSPIFLEDGIKVLGIHKQRKYDDSENYADFIEPIFRYIKNEMKFKLIYEDGICYLGEIKNYCPNGKGIFCDKNGIILYKGEFFNKEENAEIHWKNGNIYINNVFKNDLIGGNAIQYYKNGNIKYDGSFINGKYFDKGKYIYENGNYYIGQFKNNLKHGKGILFHKEGNVIYEGDYRNDIFEGKGKYINEDGQYYFGEWKNNLKHGTGVEYYKNGNIKYKGEYINDKFEGKGKYTLENGNYYIGEWKNGLRQGKGAKYYKNGNIKYDGEFSHDKFEGKGKYIWKNGNYYVGEWKNGLRHGKGVEYYRDGNIKYDGDFSHDKFEGKGKYFYENGEAYVGQWKNDLKNGKGTLYYYNRKIKYIGEFKNDKFEGYGKYIWEDGKYYIGYLKNGLKD